MASQSTDDPEVRPTGSYYGCVERLAYMDRGSRVTKEIAMKTCATRESPFDGLSPLRCIRKVGPIHIHFRPSELTTARKILI